MKIESLAGQPRLLSEQIREALTGAITSGELPGGTPLDEQQLADRFGASRTPVREALRELAVIGLVEMRPRRGVIVATVTPDQVMDLFEGLAETEALCTRLATYRITLTQRGNLSHLHERIGEVVRSNDKERFFELDQRFHAGLLEAAHNAFLARQVVMIRGRLGIFARTQTMQTANIEHSWQEHNEIMIAIARGDGEEAARRMRAHLLNNAGGFVRMLPGQQ